MANETEAQESTISRLDDLKLFAQRVNSICSGLTEKVSELETAGGETNKLEGVKVNGAALAIADKLVDLLITEGTDNGTIKVNNVAITVHGLAALAYKAKVSQADLDTALSQVIANKAAAADVTALTTKITTLIGSDTNKSARTIAAEELAKQLIPENAKESLDTLAELAAWIQQHPDDVAAINAAIAVLQAVVAGIGGTGEPATVAAYVTQAISGKVDKVAGKGLSTNDYTNADKEKLAGLSNYSHPKHAAKASGLYKITVDTEGHVSATAAVTKADITGLGVPAQDTTYAAATASKAGLMSAADKGKLDGITIATTAQMKAMLDEVFGPET